MYPGSLIALLCIFLSLTPQISQRRVTPKEAGLFKNRIVIHSVSHVSSLNGTPVVCPCGKKFLWATEMGQWLLHDPSGEVIDRKPDYLSIGLSEKTQLPLLTFQCLPDVGLVARPLIIRRQKQKSDSATHSMPATFLSCQGKVIDFPSMVSADLDISNNTIKWTVPWPVLDSSRFYSFAPVFNIDGKWLWFDVNRMQSHELLIPDNVQNSCISQNGCLWWMPEPHTIIKVQTKKKGLEYSLRRIATAQKDEQVCTLNVPGPRLADLHPRFKNFHLRPLQVIGNDLHRIGVIVRAEKNDQETAEGGEKIPVLISLSFIDIIDLASCQWLARAATLYHPSLRQRVHGISIRWITPKHMILSSGSVLSYTIETP